jgi:tRNA-binding EMAP/Myf-like protein
MTSEPLVKLRRVIIGIAGGIVGQAVNVRAHPRGDLIWLADVDLGDNGTTVQIVFGGERQDIAGEYVPVAPPGTLVTVRNADLTERTKKMRARNYRGQRSHGMLCSLDELGWIAGGPNEVAILRDVKPGQSLCSISADRWAQVVVGWGHAQEVVLGAMVDRAVPGAPRVRPTIPA